MSFLYGLVDLLLTSLITLDTLGLVGQFRAKKSPEINDYTRVCFTWIFYLTLKSFTPTAGEGFFRVLIRVIFLLGKIFVTLPLLGGTMMIYNKAPQAIKQGIDVVKSKMGAAPSASSPPSSSIRPETSSTPVSGDTRTD